jgi:hypothetical protein
MVAPRKGLPSIERILATTDKAVGLDVPPRLHKEMGAKPVAPGQFPRRVIRKLTVKKVKR